MGRERNPSATIRSLLEQTVLNLDRKATGVTTYFSLGREFPDGFNDALITNLEVGAQDINGYRFFGFCQQLQNLRGKPVLNWITGIGWGRGHFEVGSGGSGLHKLEGNGAERWSRAVFGGKNPLSPMRPEIQERIHPGVEIPGTAQAVAGASRSRSVLPNVVHL